MKPVSIYSLKVRFAYAVNYVETTNMFTGGSKIDKVPTGEVHIFEIEKVDNVEQTKATSFCGMSHSGIGILGGENAYEEKDKRPANNPMCPNCEQAYKADPRSPWYAFVNSKAVKVDA